MATSGRLKWSKYFAASDVTTRLVSKEPTVSIFSDKHELVEKIASNTQVIVPQAAEYSSKYLIKYHIDRLGYVPERFVAKPVSSGATEELRIKAKDFFQLAEPQVIRYQGKKVDALNHANLAILSTEIRDVVQNVSGNTELATSIYNASGFGPVKIQWGETPTNHINEYGKYLGEVMYLARAFRNPEIQSVSIPTSSNFGGVDSFLHCANGHTIGVSNKYGAGAKASFFTNILPYFQDCYLDEDDTVLGQVAQYHGSAKEVLYQWGFQNYLGYSSTYLKPMEIYKQIVKGTLDPKVIQSLEPAAERAGAEDEVIDMLPQSLTALFSRGLAKALNECPESMYMMTNYLKEKGFIQANLNLTDWKKGVINYSVTTPDQWELKIIGNKSAIGSITANQGLVNYELKRKARVQDHRSGDGS